jgi:hypothetical protein
VHIKWKELFTIYFFGLCDFFKIFLIKRIGGSISFSSQRTCLWQNNKNELSNLQCQINSITIISFIFITTINIVTLDRNNTFINKQYGLKVNQGGEN